MKYSNTLRAALIASITLTLSTGSMLSGVYASQIGTGTVVGSGALTTAINWNDTFIGSSASGTINGILVTARVLPILNMTISGSGTLALGNLSSTTASTGTLSIEIGTNAINGASVTAQSTNGGLQNIASGAIIINSLSVDGFADSYKFITVAGTTDSTAPGFTQSGSVNTEVNSTASVTLYTCTKAQPLVGVDDFTFSITAQPNGQTPAGDYQDVVKVTVAGNF